MEAALTFVPIAIILAVHTHSLVFTRTLCHPVFNLAKERQGDHKKASTRHLLPQTQEFGPPAPFTSSGSSEYFSGSLLAISSSFLDTQTWLLPRQKAWQGRQVPPPTAEPTNSGRHCSQWLPWKPDRAPEGLENHGGTTVRGQALGAPREGGRPGAWLGQPQPTCACALCLRSHTSSDGGFTLPQSKVLSSESPSLNSPESPMGPPPLAQHQLCPLP